MRSFSQFHSKTELSVSVIGKSSSTDSLSSLRVSSYRATFTAKSDFTVELIDESDSRLSALAVLLLESSSINFSFRGVLQRTRFTSLKKKGEEERENLKIHLLRFSISNSSKSSAHLKSVSGKSARTSILSHIWGAGTSG